MWSETARTPAVVARSAGNAVQPPPASATVFSSASRRRPTTTTSKSAEASLRAMARPIPLPPPVTRATRPTRPLILLVQAERAGDARGLRPVRAVLGRELHVGTAEEYLQAQSLLVAPHRVVSVPRVV